MNNEKFQEEKIKAFASGGPIDKLDIKVSNFDIPQAYEKVYGEVSPDS